MATWPVESIHHLEMTNHQQQTGGCVEIQKKAPVLEVLTNYHEGMPGDKMRIDSLSGDESQSWVRIRNGRNKFFTAIRELRCLRFSCLGFGDLVIDKSPVQKFGRLSGVNPTTRSRTNTRRKHILETHSQKLTVKELESARKLGGNPGHRHHILQPGGRVINGTGKNTNLKSQDWIFSLCCR